jgi:hypothetical protein
MNSLRGISKKINALLLMVMAGLALSLVLSWNYYQSRKLTGYEKNTYAAELLAYDLPAEAVNMLEQSISLQPLSEKSLKMRRKLAQIYMNELNQYEKALSELVFIRTFSGKKNEDVEEDIRFCLNRLGRVYDVDRRMMIDDGVNPVKNEVASQTLVRIGNKEAISVDEFRARLREMGIDEKSLDQQRLLALLQALAREKLLHRAADREKISREPEFIDKVREFEENLKLKTYLEKFVFKDMQIPETQIKAFMKNNAEQFKTSARVKYSCYAFATAAVAEEYLRQQERSGPYASEELDYEVVTHNKELPVDQLPAEIRSLNFSVADAIEFFGPVKIEDRYLVYQIHNYKPAQELPEAQVQEYARKSLTEKRQQELLNSKINELAKKEEMKINDEIVKEVFFKKATDSQELKD